MVAVLLAAAVTALSGCSFGKDEAPPETNTCQVDADCGTHHCDSGRCVADAQSPMQVTVVVTPKRTPSGAQAQPIVAEAFTLAGGSQTIDLRMPVPVPVHVTLQNKSIPAQASFTPIDNQNRFTAKTTKLTLLATDKDGVEPQNNALLLDGMDYRVLIQPSETTIPAHSQLFTAKAGASLEINYDKLDSKTKTFVVSNAAHVVYQVRALAESTGAPISNTGMLTGNSLTGLATLKLKFDDADAAYRLEFTPAGQKPYSTGVAGSCGDDAPQPKITVPSRAFRPDLASSSKWFVDLPELYPAVEYSGEIGLCSDQKLTADLQVSLKTEDLYLASGDSDVIQGEYETAAAASWDPDKNKFRFCARVPPGAYTVVVTPSPSLNCEIFAEKRVLRPTWMGSDELSLRMPAMLTANVLTPERMPMPKATVDVLALTAAGDVMLAPEDRSVSNYNRSGSIATGNDGSFTLSVDRGRYDVFIKPPETSNYAWRVIYDVAIASSDAREFATEIMLSEPVAVTGQLQYINGNSNDQQSLAGAEVRAYTLVNVDGQGEQRSVEIGSGHANGNGVVTLLLPPALQHSWNP